MRLEGDWRLNWHPLDLFQKGLVLRSSIFEFFFAIFPSDLGKYQHGSHPKCDTLVFPADEKRPIRQTPSLSQEAGHGHLQRHHQECTAERTRNVAPQVAPAKVLIMSCQLSFLSGKNLWLGGWKSWRKQAWAALPSRTSRPKMMTSEAVVVLSIFCGQHDSIC